MTRSERRTIRISERHGYYAGGDVKRCTQALDQDFRESVMAEIVSSVLRVADKRAIKAATVRRDPEGMAPGAERVSP